MININNKGLSLVALVITIIVLLILAAITLSVAFGNNGIITKAQEAKKKSELSEAEEILKTKIMELEVLNNGQASLNDLKNELNNIDGMELYSDNDTAIDVAYNKQYIYTIDENLNISGQREYSEKVLTKVRQKKVFDTFDRED